MAERTGAAEAMHAIDDTRPGEYVFRSIARPDLGQFCP
jgi:hypothetical protein